MPYEFIWRKICFSNTENMKSKTEFKLKELLGFKRFSTVQNRLRSSYTEMVTYKQKGKLNWNTNMSGPQGVSNIAPVYAIWSGKLAKYLIAEHWRTFFFGGGGGAVWHSGNIYPILIHCKLDTLWWHEICQWRQQRFSYKQILMIAPSIWRTTIQSYDHTIQEEP